MIPAIMKGKWKRTLTVIAGILIVTEGLGISIFTCMKIHRLGAVGLEFALPGGYEKPGTVHMYLIPGGPAQKAGILPNDHILSINAIPISDIQTLNALEKSTHRGDRLSYRWLRGQTECTAEVLVDSPFRNTGWLIKSTSQFCVGLVFICVGWLLLWKANNRGTVVFFWMSLLSGIFFANIPGMYSLPLISRLGWQNETPSPHDIPALLPFFQSVLVLPLFLHSTLVFPREHRIVRRYPAVIGWIYWLPLLCLGGLIIPEVVAALKQIRIWWLISAIATCGLIVFLRTRYRSQRMDRGWRAWHHPDWITISAAVVTLFLLLAVMDPFLHIGIVSPALVGFFVFLLLFILVLIGYLLAPCWVLVTNYRDSTGEEKRQIKWPIWGTLVYAGGRLVLGLAGVGLITVLGSRYYQMVSLTVTSEIIGSLLTALIPVSVAVAVFKYRLMDIDFIISQSVLCSLVTGIVVVIYFALSQGFGTVLMRATGIQRNSVAILATGMVAAAFVPIYRSVQRRVDSWFFPRRDYPSLLTVSAEQMWKAATEKKLVDSVVDMVQRMLAARSVAFFVQDDDGRFLISSKIGIPESLPGELSGSDPLHKLDGVCEVRNLGLPEQDMAVVNAANGRILAAVRRNERLVGILMVGEKISRQTYDMDDKSFLGALAEQAAKGIDRQRLLKEEVGSLDEALEIQKGFLPKRLPQISGFSIAGYWQPARNVSGDYYDAFMLSSERMALCIADVAGKGVPASLLMSALHTALKSIITPTTEPKELCERLHHMLCGYIPANRYITFFCAIVDVHSKRISYTNAGHLAPLLIRRDNTVIHLEEGGTPLGASWNSGFNQVELGLGAGDRIFLFTDGVSEAENSMKEFGIDRLCNLLQAMPGESADAILQCVMHSVTQFCANDFRDDVTILVFVVES